MPFSLIGVYAAKLDFLKTRYAVAKFASYVARNYPGATAQELFRVVATFRAEQIYPDQLEFLTGEELVELCVPFKYIILYREFFHQFDSSANIILTENHDAVYHFGYAIIFMYLGLLDYAACQMREAMRLEPNDIVYPRYLTNILYYCERNISFKFS